ncbi:MAG: uroporphyrinogen-III C-methyltransferase [Dehalococcoidia bacterium]|nr:uroporphyrinogen-III C-methyltransferase [Dehalococcoidia bacterium]
MAHGRASGHVWLVGAGPGDPGLITRAGLEALRRADVVLYDRLGTADLLDECREDALLIDVGKAPGRQAMAQEEINAELIEHGRAGRRVVRLKGGDPFVFGRGGEEAEALAAARIACTVVPGVTSAIGGLAAAGIPVTHRGVAASFAVVTGHEAPDRSTEGVDWTRLATAVDTIVVLMGVGRLESIAAALIAGGRDSRTPAALVQQASTPAQRVLEATLGEIAVAARDAGIEAPALLVVGEVAALRDRLALAPSGPLAGKRVLVTRTRRQASALADALRREGAVPLLLPAIELERHADAEQAREAGGRLRAHEYGWAVFTSENAVDTAFELLEAERVDARAFAGVRLCAVGTATAEALRRHGLLADLLPAEADGDGVLRALLEAGIAGQRVLLPRAEGARAALPDGLRAAGATVDELALYLAAPPAAPSPRTLERVRRGEVDVVTFTSSSTVSNLATLLEGDLEPVRSAIVACIGPQTAATARDVGLDPTVVASDRSVEGLVQALLEHFGGDADPEFAE